MKRSALVCCDDLYHPGTGIRAGLTPLLQSRAIEATWCDGQPLRELSLPAPGGLVLLCKSNVLSHADASPWLQPGNTTLRDHVRAGGRLLVLHSGVAGFQEAPAMQALAGGEFLHHPPACEVTLTPVPGHPLLQADAASFTLHDEHYFVHLNDPGARIFLTAHSSHGVQPAGWTRREGRGVVCTLTPGHFPELWLHPAYQRLLGSAIDWLLLPVAQA